MDKVKEGIFNSLQEVHGLGLDLFAGSGALGIEALSWYGKSDFCRPKF